MSLTMEDEQSRQWGELYAQLKSLLLSHGKESPFGRADFWLIDDNWGGNLHKVSVFDIGFLTPEFVEKVQNLLRRPPFENWGVMFALELEHHGEPVRTIPPGGIVVYVDRIDETWDRERLKILFGSSFAWA
ncbi:MAG TPA: hypothetical protein VKC64_15360 [Burkholderiales bacterium]|nr:hypothetical protein [Burkholderiales bacterium]